MDLIDFFIFLCKSVQNAQMTPLHLRKKISKLPPPEVEVELILEHLEKRYGPYQKS